ncbi:UNVERIFIED_CONTAM: hypothetical protein H355_006553 [Colinus virginianus]|nr:hypothetical protein H355_006553 [Colinus virginianus]
MYAIAVLGNVILLIVIKTESSLHEPMYLFLAMLAFTDLVLSTSMLPKMLAIFWHSSILSMPVVTALGSLVLLRGVLMVSPMCFLLLRKDFCQHRVISHSYCEHMAVVKLVCEDTRVNAIYCFLVALAVAVFDITVIVVSYTMILRAVMRLSSSNLQHKAFNTCVSHICVILPFYVSAIFTYVTHRYGQNIPQHIHILVANLYLLVPPTLNPIIYGVRTKQLRDKIVVLFQRKGI